MQSFGIYLIIFGIFCAGGMILAFFTFAALEKYEKWKWVKNKNEQNGK